MEITKQYEEKEKDFQKMDKNVMMTFYITYVFLLTTGTITFIEAMRTGDSKVRNILNLETCISVVAAYFYGQFVDRIKTEGLDYKKINETRYTDWMITTPIMLLVLCLALVYNSKTELAFSKYLLILLLNFGMIMTGYLGEIGAYFTSKRSANIVGFLFFAGLFGYIYKEFLYKKYNFDNALIYYSFLILWTFYGVFYEMEEGFRNVAYNILDLFSKCFVGIFFWAYFAGVFTLKE